MIVAILAMITAVVVLNIPTPRSDAQNEASRLAVKLGAASQRAIIANVVIGMDIQSSAYGFYEYRRGAWSPIDDKALGSRTVAENLQMDATIDGVTIEAIRKKSETSLPNPLKNCLLYTSPSPRDLSTSRMPSSA